ncbi:MAG: flagellar basal-body rod protein FlgF [Alphaproteobacteria bacterium]|nr:flagellar basal-body rod protein FlgF [Alphaproteobacteria bacterium]
MENTSYIALSRQTAIMRQMSVVANNIANMNSTSYKAENPVFKEYLKDIVEDGNKMEKSHISYVQDAGLARDYVEGAMIDTGGKFDLAIHGDAYFAVEAPKGERYTRNGQFKLDEEGQLVTSDGYPVLSESGTPIFIAPNETNINVSKDGAVSTEFGTIGKLQMVRFENRDALQKTYGGLYRADEIAGMEVADDFSIEQGMLENSNVKPVVEMTKMIALQRSFEGISRMLDEESSRQRKAMSALSGIKV